ncbi:hypothetical protein ACGFIY_21620 [Micromonospora chersina]|uniref:hypothetical protein n=1 Tax=Micromonospora chersina TaxID=47854 RepID=UPI0037105393
MSEPEKPTTPACLMPGHPGPAGHVNACQLCPASPTYWRGQQDNPNDLPRPCNWTPAPATDGNP